MNINNNEETDLEINSPENAPITDLRDGINNVSQGDIAEPFNSTESEGKHSEDGIILKNTEELWDEIGFHKLLAGFWYNITYTLIGILISMSVMGVLMNTFYPFPESMGYRDIVYNMFYVLFVAFDMGTGMVMDRYIARENIRDISMMVKYIQYFIWYQAITGLIQVTIVSVYALFIVPETNRAYAIWLMLIVGSTQYPGFLGVFKNVLDSLQHYNKTQLLNFLMGTLFQRLTEITFILIGKKYGESHPAVGPLMGIAIGSTIGLYIDDFIAMLVSANFFAKVMKDYGIRPIDCLRVDFTWEEVKEPFWYGIKTGMPGLLNTILSFINFTLWITYFPQYTTYSVVAFIGKSIPDVILWFGTPRVTPLLSESYQNGKKELTRYYIGQYIRFYAEIHGFFAPLILVVTAVLPIAWITMGMINYLPGLAFVIPGLVFNLLIPYLGIPGQLLYAIGKPNFAIVTGLLNSLGNTIFLACVLVWWKIPITHADWIPWLFWGYTLPFSIFFSLVSYYYVHKRVLRLYVPGKQILYGFALSSFIVFILGMIVKRYSFDTLYLQYGFYVAAAITMFLLMILALFAYFPLSALMGGWDKENLTEFQKAAYMSGPSKIFVIPIYKMVRWSAMHSKLHNKFAPSMEVIEREAMELLQIKRMNREEYKKTHS